MIHYNPDLDRSEDFGWKKYLDESVPTEAEQQVWALVMISCPLASLVLLFLI